MKPADFLFPRDLEVTPVTFKNILVVGSCAAGVWALKMHCPDTRLDYLILNNFFEEVQAAPLPLEQYDFQFVQLNLRSIVSDRIIKVPGFIDPDTNRQIFDDALNTLELYLDACLKYNKDSGLLTFVSNFPVPQRSTAPSLIHAGTSFDIATLVAALNTRLNELVAKYTNVYVADYEGLSGAIGKRYFQADFISLYANNSFWQPGMRDFDVSEFYNAHEINRLDPLPPLQDVYPSQLAEMLEAFVRQWEAMYRSIHQIDQVKMVIFDLDDTMWRGQIAEHYSVPGKYPWSDGWPHGVWEAVHHLKARGILVGIASKNEESLVRERWDRAAYDPWLSFDDFLFREINWNPKAENIAKMIKAASLTPKSVVFVDDNPVEREAVRMALPGIRVIGSNPYLTRRILLWSPETQVARLTDESRAREDMMRRQLQREADRAAVSREEFLQQLNCRVRLARIDSTGSPQFGRAIELINKTNQFNTTGRRWSVAELTAFFASGGLIYGFEVEDRYTAYGWVGFVLVRDGAFEQFAMSCRVLGLGIEASVIATIVEMHGAERYEAHVVETEANMVCRDVYARAGFAAMDGVYRLTDRSALKPPAEHLTITTDEDEEPVGLVA